MAVNSFIFNGTSSISHGLYVSGSETFGAPEKSYEKVSVPGRNGDLLLSNNRFSNITVIYPSIIIDKYDARTEDIRSWLLSPDGYCRLEDTYHPDEFRMAMFSGPIDFDTLMLCAGSVDLEFYCKPQRFLKEGEAFKTYSASATFQNPTKFTALPLIICTTATSTAGTITVNGKTFSIKNTNTQQYLYIDCENENVLNAVSSGGSFNPGNVNCNMHVTGTFPKLIAGTNTLSFSGGVSSISIKPRWWTI